MQQNFTGLFYIQATGSILLDLFHLQDRGFQFHPAGPYYPDFSSIMRLRAFLPPPPPAWMSVHSGLPHNIFQVLLTVCWYSFILLGGEKHFHKQLSCQSTTQWPNQGSNPQFPSESKHSTPGHHTSPSARNYFI